MPIPTAQLRCFHAAARTGSVSAAAARLKVSQPAVTQQIRALERTAGTALFVRHRRGVELTAAGRELAALTTAWDDATARIEEHVAGLSALAHGHLRVGCDSEAPGIALLARFRAAWPAVAVDVLVGNRTAIWEALREDRVDAAVVTDPPDDPGVDTRALAVHDLALWLRADHPLAEADRVDPATLPGLPLVHRELGSGSRRLLEGLLHDVGVRLVPIVTVEGREAMREAVRAGLGVGYGIAQELGDPSLRATVLAGGEACSHVLLARRHAARDRRAVAALWEV